MIPEDLWLLEKTDGRPWAVVRAAELGPIVDPACLDDDVSMLRPVASAGRWDDFYDGREFESLNLLCPVEGGERWLAQYVEYASYNDGGGVGVAYLLVDRHTYEQFSKEMERVAGQHFATYTSQVWADPWPEGGDCRPEYDREACPVCGARYSCPEGAYREVRDARLYAVHIPHAPSEVPEGHAFFQGRDGGWLLPEKVGDLRLLILPPRKARRLEAHYGVGGLEVAEGRYAFYTVASSYVKCYECKEELDPLGVLHAWMPVQNEVWATCPRCYALSMVDPDFPIPPWAHAWRSSRGIDD